jgi:hypothetical protein
MPCQISPKKLVFFEVAVVSGLAVVMDKAGFVVDAPSTVGANRTACFFILILSGFVLGFSIIVVLAVGVLITGVKTWATRGCVDVAVSGVVVAVVKISGVEVDVTSELLFVPLPPAIESAGFGNCPKTVTQLLPEAATTA